MTIYTLYFLLALLVPTSLGHILHDSGITHHCHHDSQNIELQVNKMNHESLQNHLRGLATQVPLPIRIVADYKSNIIINDSHT